MNAPMIAIDGLTKDYGSTRALRGVSFNVPRGQVLGFLGPNGAGKSTTMKIVTGFVTPTSGSVKVAGLDVMDDPVEARKHVGYLPEANPLYDDMMVQEYLEFAADVRQIPKSERNSRIEGAVERCGLGHMRGKNIRELSKGYRQRTGLAQAILHDPDVLILDEPTSGLDPNQIVEIRELITELGQEKTVVMSTHVLPEVQATCSRVLIISHGEVVADDTPDNLVADGGGRIDVELLPRSDVSITEAQTRTLLEKLPGVRDVVAAPPGEEASYAFTLRVGDADPRRDLFDAAVEGGLILMRLDRQKVSLEETFRDLTTKESVG